MLRSNRGAENSNNNLALLSRMGSVCSRGRRAPQTEEEPDGATSEDWELIAPAVPVVDQPSAYRGRFLFQGNRVLPAIATPACLKSQRVVKKIKNLLVLRKLWSRLGGWLNVSAFRHHPSCKAVAWTYVYLGRLLSGLLRRCSITLFADVVGFSTIVASLLQPGMLMVLP